MLNYEEIKKNPRQFLALTSMKVEEFDFLCAEFHTDWWQYISYHTLRGKKRKHPLTKERSTGPLCSTEDKLLFLLVYLKTNPIQELHAINFGIVQGKVSEWIELLTRLLCLTLDRLGLLPCREPEALKDVLEQLQSKVINLDATERRVERSSDYQVQKEYYSGKKKAHTEKNNLITTDDQTIVYLSQTYEGKTHDKAICDEEVCAYPDQIELRQDSGYLGHRPEGVIITEPTKKPKGKELTAKQKQTNKKVSKKRVVVEHAISGVKRCRIVKDINRSIRIWLRDMVMEICCGLHNLRVRSSLRAYARSHVLQIPL